MRRHSSSRIALRRGCIRSSVLGFALLGATRLVAQAAGTAHEESKADSLGTGVVLDRAIAVVNNHLILASDLNDEMRLSVLEPDHEVSAQITPLEALQQLISRALIEQQIRDQEARTLEPDAVDVGTRLAEIRKQLPACVNQHCETDEGWNAFLKAHGLTPERVEIYLRYRLEILRFIEQRFRQGIQISDAQIATYYRDILLPQYPAGQKPPALDQVSQRIQEILLQQQVNVLFDAWLGSLRQQGDVEILDPELATAIQAAGDRQNPVKANP